MKRAPALLPALLALAGAAACTDPNLLSGTFQSSQPLRLAGDVETDTLYLVLNLRHFGPEVGGVVLFSTSQDQIVEPANGCACRYVVGGVTKVEQAAIGESSEYAFTFRFRVPQSPCAPGDDAPFVAVRLLSDETGDVLTGELRLGDEVLGTGPWVFTRLQDARDLPERVDECEDDQARP